ncbi:MAG TPA: succinylglutamate desuccinylase/aspartoacylase family protein [Pyrinomonadaceae bacterium]|nr:succinylglutamate desuccinylase/aspartoacylase family protein [Pyrinomonadaceae bacterium]
MVITTGVHNFDPDRLGPSTKQKFFVELSPATGGELVGFPVLVANGARAGKTLVAFAGVHGDEYEGMQALHEIYHALDVEQMSGRLIAVPVVNLPAYHAVSRHSPVDHLNLARTFPGRREGTLSERLAHYLSELIIARADFFVDLHSAGIRYLIPPMIGYGITDTEHSRVAQHAAEIFGTPVLWGHPGQVPPGRTISEADRRHIPWLYVEASGGARISPDELRYYTNGLLNLMRFLHILPGDNGAAHIRHRLQGKGDIDDAIFCDTAGFFAPAVNVLDQVSPGRTIGVVRNIFGEPLEEIKSERGGYVILLRALPVVQPGDTVCVITDGSSV